MGKPNATSTKSLKVASRILVMAGVIFAGYTLLFYLTASRHPSVSYLVRVHKGDIVPGIGELVDIKPAFFYPFQVSTAYARFTIRVNAIDGAGLYKVNLQKRANGDWYIYESDPPLEFFEPQ